MARFKVTAERFGSRVAVVQAEDVDEAIAKFDAREVEEEWIEVGADEEEVLSVEQLAD